MKTSIKKVNDKQYLYLSDTLFMDHGKSKQKFKSLGPLGTQKNINEKKQNFLSFLIKEEAELRIKYWEKRIKDPKFNKYTSIKKLEELRSSLSKLHNNIGHTAATIIKTFFLIDFIYNSNKIEGSKIPKEKVEEIITKNKKTNDEINNTVKAINYVNTKFNFNIKHIIKLHSILIAHEPIKNGLRTEKIIAVNSEVTPWPEIRQELQALLNWYEKNRRKMYPLELAFLFYYRFERIHPFTDGNGRIGRLIMNRILKINKYHPIIIWNEQRSKHNSVFEKAMSGQIEKYYIFMQNQYKKTYKIYLQNIDKILKI